MGKNTFRNIIIAIVLLISIAIGIKKFNLLDLEKSDTSPVQINQNVVSSRMTYGRFLEFRNGLG